MANKKKEMFGMTLDEAYTRGYARGYNAAIDKMVKKLSEEIKPIKYKGS